MATKQVPIAEATLEQLIDHGEQGLGLNFGPNKAKITIQRVIERLVEAQPGIETVLVVESDALPEYTSDPQLNPDARPIRRSKKAMRGTSSRNDPVVLLTIHEQQGEGGNRPVSVGVNGLWMVVPRGSMQRVPWRYYLVLNGSIEDHITEDMVKKELAHRHTQSYPFQVNEYPPEAEVAAWNAKQEGTIEYYEKRGTLDKALLLDEEDDYDDDEEEAA